MIGRCDSLIRTRRRTVVGVLLFALTWLGHAQGGIESQQPAWSAWEDALRALQPTEPFAYLKLAEEIDDAAAGSDGDERAELRALARQLYALAGSLDPQRLGRSACLALAVHELDALERDRLHALAELLPGLDVASQWRPADGEQTVPPSAAIVLCEAIGFYRQGQGNRSLSLLQRQHDGEVLRRYGHLLPSGAARFLEDCKHYTNGRKPTIFQAELARMLVLESALLAGTERSWSGEALLTAAAPLIEIDPDRLAESLGVDVTKAYFADGDFVRVRP